MQDLNISSIGSEATQLSHDPQHLVQNLKNSKADIVGKREAHELTRILSTQTDKRTKQDIEEMKECLSKVKFLQEYRSSPFFEQVLRNLELETFNQDNVLFKQFDVADKFYIILSGSIGLYIRAPNSVENLFKKENESPNYADSSPNGGDVNTFKINADSESEQRVTSERKRDGGEQKKVVNQFKNKSDKKINQLINLPHDIIQQSNQQNSAQPAQSSQREKNILGVGVREVARLEFGEAFGELGLLFNEKRSATAICLDPTSLLVLRRAVFEKYLGKNAGGKVSIMVEFYSNLWQMRELTPRQILQLSTKTTLTECRNPTIVIRQGEVPKGIFFVRKGNVKILTSLNFKTTSSSKSTIDETHILKDQSLLSAIDLSEPSAEEIKNKQVRKVEVQVDEIGDGGIFGDHEAFQGCKVPFSAITSAYCDVLVVSLSDLKESITPKLFKEFQEGVKRYPAAQIIKKQYVENLFWASMKNDIVQSFNNETINKFRIQHIFQHRQPFLPKISISKFDMESSQDEGESLQFEEEASSSIQTPRNQTMKSNKINNKMSLMNSQGVSSTRNININQNSSRQQSPYLFSNVLPSDTNLFSGDKTSNLLTGLDFNSSLNISSTVEKQAKSFQSKKMNISKSLIRNQSSNQDNSLLNLSKLQASTNLSSAADTSFPSQLLKNKNFNLKSNKSLEKKQQENQEILDMLTIKYNKDIPSVKYAFQKSPLKQEESGEKSQFYHYLGKTTQNKNKIITGQRLSQIQKFNSNANFTHIMPKIQFQSPRMILPKVNKQSRASQIASEIY